MCSLRNTISWLTATKPRVTPGSARALLLIIARNSSLHLLNVSRPANWISPDHNFFSGLFCQPEKYWLIYVCNLIEQIEGHLLPALWPDHESQFWTTLTNEVIVPIFLIFVKVVVKIVWTRHDKAILQLTAAAGARVTKKWRCWQSWDKNTKWASVSHPSLVRACE